MGIKITVTVTKTFEWETDPTNDDIVNFCIDDSPEFFDEATWDIKREEDNGASF